MKKKYRIFAALIGAALSTFAMFFWQSSPEEQQIEPVNVYTATQRIEINSQVTPDMVKEQQMDPRFFSEGMVQELRQVNGKRSNIVIFPGEILRQERFSEQKTIVFTAEERKMNIPVSLDVLGGFPRPGDNVDIIWYLPHPEGSNGESKLILENIQLVALYDQQGTELSLKEMNGESSQAISLMPAIATIKVTLFQGRVLQQAVETGKIRLLTRIESERG